MKKAYNISLSGRFFHLEEDAGNKLEQYISTLENYYSREEGGQEIMNDIENRIAELFQEYLTASGRTVIQLNDVNQVIAVMGNPDELLQEDPEEPVRQKADRKLYRDVDNSIFGGVAAGLSAYSDIPVIVFRLLFVVLAFFYGITLLIYAILWLIVPAAVTTRQKLEMKGERINISTLEKKIRDNINEVKSSGKVQHFFRETGNALARIATTTGNILGPIADVILKIISIILIIISLTLMILVACLLFGNPFTEFSFIAPGLSYLMTPFYVTLSKIAFILLLFPPLLLVFWCSIRYLFSIKARTSVIALSLLACWISGIVLTLYIVFSQGLELKEESRDSAVTSLQLPGKHIVIKVRDSYPQKAMSCNQIYPFSYRNKDHLLLLMPEIKIKTAHEELPQLTIVKKAKGPSPDIAYHNARSVHYDWQLSNDTLYLDNYFALNPETKWRLHEVEAIISLPEGYTVTPDYSIGRRLFFPYWGNSDRFNRIYRMTPEGMRPLS